MSFLNIRRGLVFAARRGAAPLMVALSSVLLLVGVVFAPPTAADHGVGHNGETMELSATEVSDGDVVTVTLGSWLPGNTVTIVTCFVFPVLGPVDCELSSYGAHTVVVDDDGTATYDYPIAVVPGRCDETVTCFVVAADGVGLDANYAAQEVSFLPAAAADDPVSEPSPEPDPTPAPEPDPPAPDTAADDGDGSETETAIGESGDSSGTSVLAWLIPVIAVAALVIVGGGLLARRRGRGDGAPT